MNTTTSISMKTPADAILSLIKKEKVVTSSEIAETLSVSWNTADKYLLELALDGKIERIKKTGVTLWVIK